MSEVTFNIVRDGVMSALSKRFPHMDVYGEEIKQNLDPPCFYVKLLDGDHKKELGQRYKRHHYFDIHFFAEDRKNRSMHEIAEQLYDVFDLININNTLCKGTGMKHEIIDSVLHFFVEFNFLVRKEQPLEIKMKSMKREGYVRE